MQPLRWDADQERSTDLTPEALHEIVCEVEREAGLTVVSAVVGSSGPRVKSQLVRSAIDLHPGPRTVTLDDVREVLEQAESGVRGANALILQLVPLEFLADNQSGLSNPVGLQASRLEAYVRVVETDRHSFESVHSVVKGAGIRIHESILGGFAAAFATVTPHELAKGVVNLDFGRSASSLTAYADGSLRIAAGIPIGWDNLVRDVMSTFGTEASVASSLITQLGRVEYDALSQFASIFVPGPDPGDPVGSGAERSWSLLIKVITRRVDDYFHYLRSELQSARLAPENAHTLVLTGDMAALPGIARAATVATGLKARVGVPRALKGMPAVLRHPGWACAAGLAFYAHRLAQNGTERTDDATQEDGFLPEL